jgi:hypothetical protein
VADADLVLLRLGQETQAVDLAAPEYKPTPHAEQADEFTAPTVVENVPALQLMHPLALESPSVGENDPAAQD